MELGPQISENHVKKSQSRVASHHPHRQGMGRYRCSMGNLLKHEEHIKISGG